MPEVNALLDPFKSAPSMAAHSALEFDVFVSYSRKDKDFCALLERSLRAYKPPGGLDLARRLSVFRDTSDLVGADYFVSIDGCLRGARKFIVICSPDARSSEYVNDEIRRFIDAGGRDNIIPIIIAGFPNNEAKPDDKAAMAFPDALCSALKMPLAIDYRGFDVKKHKLDRGAYAGSWYTLIASILGRSREQVEERERKRAARVRRITTGITSSVITVLFVFLCIALSQWWLAQTRTMSALIQASNASFTIKDYWGALKAGLRAAQTFRSLPFAEYIHPDIRPELSQSVQQALYNVREYNRLICETDCDVARQSNLGQINWNPDRKSIAFVSGRHVVTLWKPGDNARQLIYPLYPQEGEDEIRSVSWRRLNGKTLLVTSSKHGLMKSFDPNGGQVLTSTKIAIGTSYIWGTSWRPDGQELVAISSPNHGVMLLTPDNIQLDSPLSNSKGTYPYQVYRASWGPKPEQWLAAGDLNHVVHLQSQDNHQVQLCNQLPVLIQSMGWRPDGESLAVGLDNGTVQLFNLASGRCTRGPTLTGSDGVVSSLTWSRNGRLATASDEDKEIRWWDINGTLSDASDIPTDAFYLPAVAGGMQWSPDGKVLAVLDQSDSVRLLKDNSLLKTVPVRSNAMVRSAALSRDEQILAFADDKGVYLSRQNDNDIWRSDPQVVEQYSHEKSFASLGQLLETVSWSPDEKFFAYTTDNGGVSIRNREGTRIESLPNEAFGNGGAFAISWHPNGKTMAIGAGDGKVTVWDVDTKQELDNFDCVDWAQSVSWNPKDKGLLAVGCHNTQGAYLLRWDPDTQKFDSEGKGYRLRDARRKEITAENIRVSWSPNGKKLAISANNRITLMNKQGEPIRTIPTPDEVGKVAWSPDSRMFAVPSADVVKLFKVVKTSTRDDLPITVFKGHTHRVTSVTWNNQTLVSASEDGTVKLWQIDKSLADNPFDTLVKQSCIWLADYLDKNRLVAKDDSDLQELCSNVQTAAATPALPPVDVKAPPAPAQRPADREETKRSSVH